MIPDDVPARGSAVDTTGVDAVAYRVAELARRIHELVAAIGDEQAYRRTYTEEMAVRIVLTGSDVPGEGRRVG